VRLLVVSDLEEKFRHPIVYGQDDNVHLLGLRKNPGKPGEPPAKANAGRGRNDSGGIVGAALASLLVKLLQWLQSPGPLFFEQERAGLMNNSFRILKFRTMHVNNPDPARKPPSRTRASLAPDAGCGDIAWTNAPISERPAR